MKFSTLKAALSVYASRKGTGIVTDRYHAGGCFIESAGGKHRVVQQGQPTEGLQGRTPLLYPLGTEYRRKDDLLRVVAEALAD